MSVTADFISDLRTLEIDLNKTEPGDIVRKCAFEIELLPGIVGEVLAEVEYVEYNSQKFAAITSIEYCSPFTDERVLAAGNLTAREYFVDHGRTKDDAQAKADLLSVDELLDLTESPATLEVPLYLVHLGANGAPISEPRKYEVAEVTTREPLVQFEFEMELQHFLHTNSAQPTPTSQKTR